MVARAAWLALALLILPACVSAYGGYYRNPKKRSKTGVVKSTAAASGIALPTSFGTSGFGARTTAPTVSVPQASSTDQSAAPAASTTATPAASTGTLSAQSATGLAGAAAASSGLTNSAGAGGPGFVLPPIDSGPGSGGGPPSAVPGDPGKDISCPSGMHREASGCVPGTTGLLGTPSSAGHAVVQ